MKLLTDDAMASTAFKRTQNQQQQQQIDTFYVYAI